MDSRLIAGIACHDGPKGEVGRAKCRFLQGSFHWNTKITTLIHSDVLLPPLPPKILPEKSQHRKGNQLAHMATRTDSQIEAP